MNLAPPANHGILLTAPNPDLWAPALKTRTNPQLRLFCFPYAGGGLPIFRGWPEALPASVEVRVLQLPGRGPRFRENRFEDLSLLARTVSSQIEPLLVGQPFAFFGHSFGALLAFETARQLRKSGWIPQRLFASGNNAPQIPEPLPAIHALPDEAFLDELKALNGIQQAVLDSKELLDLFLPVIRSDFKMLETYVCDTSQAPLQCPISSFGGEQDPRTTLEGLDGWRSQTTEAFELTVLPGGHFFLETTRPLLLEALAARVLDPGRFGTGPDARA